MLWALDGFGCEAACAHVVLESGPPQLGNSPGDYCRQASGGSPVEARWARVGTQLTDKS